MARRKELNSLTFEILDGFGGTGAVNEASPANTDTTFGVDTEVLNDSETIVPVGARFTTAGNTVVRTVTATQNSQQWTVDMTGAGGGGTFDITVNGSTEAGNAYNIAAATLQTALEALVGAGNITVTLATSVYTITFAGDLANISTNTLTVDGGSLTTPDGETVTAVQDGTTTWEITFTPALATATGIPANNDVITYYPRKLEVKVGEGDIEFTKNKDPQIDLNRGILDGARAGNQQPMDVNFSFVYDWIRSSTTDVPTVDEVLEREGEAADWTNAAADSCEPYQVTLKVIDAPDCGSEQAEILLFKYFLPNSISASVESATVSVSGQCVATKPVVYRVANVSDTIEITNS